MKRSYTPRASGASALLACQRWHLWSAGGRSPQQKAALSRLMTEMTTAGALVRSIRLQPSTKAKRLVFTANEMRVIDGPFTETKELIGRFAVLELSGMEEAIQLCQRYAEESSRRRARP